MAALQKHGFFKRIVPGNRHLQFLIRRKTHRETIDYWRSPQDTANAAKSYLAGTEKSQMLVNVFRADEIPVEGSVLELGCNVGRNLNLLLSNGYRNLSGVEVSSEALGLMRIHYADLAGTVKVYDSTIEAQIKRFRDAEFDVVFTMAVLMHIHRDSDFVFGEIARITKSTLIVIEDEEGLAVKNFTRNYKKIFERLGFTQTRHEDCRGRHGFGDKGMHLRVFKKGFIGGA